MVDRKLWHVSGRVFQVVCVGSRQCHQNHERSCWEVDLVILGTSMLCLSDCRQVHSSWQSDAVLSQCILKGSLTVMNPFYDLGQRHQAACMPAKARESKGKGKQCLSSRKSSNQMVLHMQTTVAWVSLSADTIWLTWPWQQTCKHHQPLWSVRLSTHPRLVLLFNQGDTWQSANVSPPPPDSV